MVTPQWGSFQTPEDLLDQNESNQQEENSVNAEEVKQEEQPKWGDFDTPNTYQGPINPTADEGWGEYFVRHAISSASRLGEQMVGRHGNLEKFAKNTLVSFPETGGIIGKAISEYIGPEKWEELIMGSPDNPNKQVFPTSQNLKDISQGISGGYTKPKTKGEERFQEKIEDIGSTLRGGRTAQSNVVNSILIPTAANYAKDIMEDLGFSKDNANLVKFVVWSPLSLAYNVSAPNHASELMNRGRNGMPNTVQANVNRLYQSLGNLNFRTNDPRSALARSQIDNIRRDIANGQTSVRSLMDTYDGINAAKRSRDMFSLNAGDQRYARHAINQVRDVIRDEIYNSGSVNPQAVNDWQNGVQAWATVHRSNAISNWVQNLFGGKYAKLAQSFVAPLFGIAATGAAKAPIVGGPLLGAVPAGLKTAQTLYRMWNNPVLGEYYWNAIGAVLEDNVPAFISNYLKLNKKVESESTKPEKKTKAKDTK